jgi:tRNA (cytidine/uridine-2'-O-)-methyltransferase
VLHIALHQPQIPPNTGNIMRLCANAGAALHLIHPLGFRVDEKSLRRAGLDYKDACVMSEHENFEAFAHAMGERRILAFTTKGQHTHSDIEYQDEDVLLFGSETQGLPAEILDFAGARYCLRIPMREGSRSMNISNAAAIVVYEAWRQLNYS